MILKSASLKTAFILSICCFVYSFSQDTRGLEKRMSELEKRVASLERRASSEPAAYQNYTVSKIQDYMITAKLFTKKYQPADYSNPRDNLAFLITFYNYNPNNVGGLRGDIIFLTEQGDTLISFYADISKLLPANGNNSWYGGIPYDPTNNNHRRLLETDLNSISLKLRLDEIIFSDGTKKIFK